MNEFLFFISILLTFSSIIAVYRFFGKTGLFCWVCFASVVANIIVEKAVTCFGLTTTLGNVLFGSVFLANDIITEKFGKKEAQKAVFLGLVCNVALIIISLVVMLYRPSDTDFANEAFKTIFKLTPRICLGSICAYAFGNFLDIYIFDRIKSIHGDKKLWIRNNISTMVSQLLDNFVLHTIAFLGIMTFKEVVILSLNVWLFEIIIALADTPFIYIAKNRIPDSE